MESEASGCRMRKGKTKKIPWFVQNNPPETALLNDPGLAPKKVITWTKSLTETGWDSESSRGPEKPNKAP